MCAWPVRGFGGGTCRQAEGTTAASLRRVLLALIIAVPHIAWHGGNVLVSPQYHNIYWGSYWERRPDHVAWLDAFTARVAPSWELASQVDEYSLPGQRLGPGSFAGSIIVNESPPSVLTDRGLEDFVRVQLLSGTVPPANERNVYAVFLPPGVRIAGEERALGYHTRSAYGFFEIMVHFDPRGGDSADRDVAGIVYSHEMAETMTNPALDAWYDAATRDEIGDVCQQHSTKVGPYLIQQEWSNAQGGCTAARDVPLSPGLGGQCPVGTSRQGSDCVVIGGATAAATGCASSGFTPPALALALLFLRRRLARPSFPRS